LNIKIYGKRLNVAGHLTINVKSYSETYSGNPLTLKKTRKIKRMFAVFRVYLICSLYS
jgi:hypothetical protein